MLVVAGVAAVTLNLDDNDPLDVAPAPSSDENADSAAETEAPVTPLPAEEASQAEVQVQPQPQPQTRAPQDQAAPATPLPTEVLPQTRQVIPGREANIPQAGDEVARLPTPPIPVQPPRPVNLGIVVVEAANRLDTRRGKVTLSGTRAVDEDAICRLDDGRTPLCSVLARTAVRRLVGQRRVDCVLGVREDAGEDHVSPCSLGETDLALLVVSQGWAFANADASSDLRAAQTVARDERRGLWAVMDSAN